MMLPDSHTGPNKRDDGFRIADAAVERAIQDVMSTPKRRHSQGFRPFVALAASLALILGLGLALSDAMKPEPCVTFACQLETLSDEELAIMMDLLEQESLSGLEDPEWPTLY